MAAFFRNTVQPAKDGNSKDSTPSVLVPQTEEDAKRWDVLPKDIASAKDAVDLGIVKHGLEYCVGSTNCQVWTKVF